MNTSTLFNHCVLIRKPSEDGMRNPYSEALVALHLDAVPTPSAHMTTMFMGIHR